MKQYITIEIERELDEKEISYFENLTSEGIEQLIKEQTDGVYQIFEQQGDIKKSHYNKLDIRYE